MTQMVRSFGANDFRLAVCCRSPASSQESRKRSAPPGIAMAMISDQPRLAKDFAERGNHERKI
jgi:hypothetical protein